MANGVLDQAFILVTFVFSWLLELLKLIFSFLYSVVSSLVLYLLSLASSSSSASAQSAKPTSFKIAARSFAVIKQLGEGGFSFVYLVRETTPGHSNPPSANQFALKRVRVELPEHEERLKAEIAAHSAINSPHVIKLLDSTIIKQTRASSTGSSSGLSFTHQQLSTGDAAVKAEGLLLLPYYPKGTLQDLIELNTATKHSMEVQKILQIALDICEGLRAFHNRNPPLAFRDLKPANVLLDDSGKAILMDLGSVAPARVKVTNRKEAVALQEYCAETVTAPFRAPELFDPPSDSSIDERTDVWALGCTVFALAYGTPPFDGSATAAVGGQVVFPRPDPYSPAFRNLIRAILVPDPKARLSIDHVIHKLTSFSDGLTGA